MCALEICQIKSHVLKLKYLPQYSQKLSQLQKVIMFLASFHEEMGSGESEPDLLFKLKFFWRSWTCFSIGGAPSGVKVERSTLKFAFCSFSDWIAELTVCWLFKRLVILFFLKKWTNREKQIWTKVFTRWHSLFAENPHYAGSRLVWSEGGVPRLKELQHSNESSG